MPLKDPAKRKAYNQDYARRNPRKSVRTRPVYTPDERRQRNTENSARWKAAHVDDVKAAVKSRNADDPIPQMFRGAKRRAIQHGIPFTITVADIRRVWTGVCPYLLIPLVVGDGKVGPNSPTLDRIRPELGYIPGNIEVISRRANLIKSDATPDEVLAVGHRMETVWRAQSL